MCILEVGATLMYMVLYSQVLVSYLPAVIEYCSECRKPSTYKTQLPIDQVVDFLQDFLDMVAVHHVHLEVQSSLFYVTFSKWDPEVYRPPHIKLLKEFQSIRCST